MEWRKENFEAIKLVLAFKTVFKTATSSSVWLVGFSLFPLITSQDRWRPIQGARQSVRQPASQPASLLAVPRVHACCPTDHTFVMITDLLWFLHNLYIYILNPVQTLFIISIVFHPRSCCRQSCLLIHLYHVPLSVQCRLI